MTRWTGKGDGTLWTTAANWSAGVPASGVDAQFTAGTTETVRLGGYHAALTAGALIVQTDSLTLSSGTLNLAPQTASSGNTFDIALSSNAHLTVAQGATLAGSNVAAIGQGTGATLTVNGTVAEEYGIVSSGTLDISGAKAHWLSGDSGLYIYSSTFTVEAGGRVNTGGRLAQYPAAALQMDGNSTGLVTGAGSVVRLANTFVSEFSGTSTLTIADGGQVFSGGGTIGNDGDGTLVVTGAGSTFNASRGLSVGGQVPVNSRLVVENGGTVTLGRYGLELDGTLMIDSTATFTAPDILSGGGIIMAQSGAVTLASALHLYVNNSDSNSTRTTYLEAAPGATLTLTGTIVSADPGDTTEILDAASGHVVLAHDNKQFVGTTDIYGATLEISASNGAGSGGLHFVGGTTPATLQIDSNLSLPNVITGFSAADTIDLAGFDATADLKLTWTPDSGGGTLGLKNTDGQHTLLHFAGSDLSQASFATAADSHGGTLITHT